VPERTSPTDFEVFDVVSVTAFDDTSREQEFLPLFATPQDEPDPASGYYSVVREPRLATDRTRRDGPRSAYIGTEIFISLVDPREAPFRQNLRQLSTRVRCTNRDLPLFMPIGQDHGEMTLTTNAPVHAVQLAAGPSRPQSAMREGGVALAPAGPAVAELPVLAERRPEQGALTLRELLSLFSHGADVGLKRQIEGVRDVSVKPVVRRHPVTRPDRVRAWPRDPRHRRRHVVRRRQRRAARRGAARLLLAPCLDEQLRADGV
jgi:type VI secretion system protein ImpG